MADPSLEQRKMMWNNVAKNYAESGEGNHLPTGITLAKMTGVESAKNILEVGCGTGLLAEYWSHNLHASVNYTAIDFSDEMLRIGQERRDKKKDKTDGVEITYKIADADSLDFVADESIDVYFGHIFINVVANPEKTVKEALRVLKKGGKIGFCISPSSDRNTFMKLIRDTGAGQGIEEVKNFARQLTEGKEYLLKLAKDTGIKVEYCWDQDSVYEINEEQVISLWREHPMGKRVMSGFSEEVREKFAEGLRKNYREFRTNLVPMTSNFVFIVGSKPE